MRCSLHWHGRPNPPTSSNRSHLCKQLSCTVVNADDFCRQAIFHTAGSACSSIRLLRGGSSCSTANLAGPAAAITPAASSRCPAACIGAAACTNLIRLLLLLLPWEVPHSTGHKLISNEQVEYVWLSLVLPRLRLLLLLPLGLLLQLPGRLHFTLRRLAAVGLSFRQLPSLAIGLLALLLLLLTSLPLLAHRRSAACRQRCRRRRLSSQQLEAPLPHRT